MDRFQTEYRRLVDRLVTDLAKIGRELAHEQIEVARAAERAAAPRVSPRLQRALERAEEKRRLAAERRAAVQAAREEAARRKAAAGGAADDDGEPTPSVGRRGKASSTPLSPPPLFVHKRTRDGAIQKLERSGSDSVPPPPPPA
jgi:hypothetical protein